MNNVMIYDEKQYKMACTEMLEILKYIPELDFKKIPQDVIEALKNNMDKTYEFKLDLNKDIEKQKISNLTKAMIENFYRDYWVTEPERKMILKEQEIARRKVDEEKNIKFNTKNVFETKDVANKKEENKSLDLVEVKEKSFFEKILEKIKSIFRKH